MREREEMPSMRGRERYEWPMTCKRERGGQWREWEKNCWCEREIERWERLPMLERERVRVKSPITCARQRERCKANNASDRQRGETNDARERQTGETIWCQMERAMTDQRHARDREWRDHWCERESGKTNDAREWQRVERPMTWVRDTVEIQKMQEWGDTGEGIFWKCSDTLGIEIYTIFYIPKIKQGIFIPTPIFNNQTLMLRKRDREDLSITCVRETRDQECAWEGGKTNNVKRERWIFINMSVKVRKHCWCNWERERSNYQHAKEREEQLWTCNR